MPYDRKAWLASLRAENRPQGYFFTHARFTPDDLLRDPADYQGQEAICISCTQLADESEQKRLVRAWAVALPTLANLRRVHFTSRFPNSLLAPLCRMTWLEELSIKWSGLKDIGPIQNLVNLKALDIGSSPSISNPETIGKLAQLKRLRIENVRAVYDLGWIGDMPQLDQLGVEGSMWSVQKVEAITPLKRLAALNRLSMVGAKIKDRRSLMDIAEMPSLQVFDTTWNWPKGALRRLVDARPDLWVNGQRGPEWQDLEDRVMDLS